VTVSHILAQAKQAGVVLAVDDGRVRFRARRGALSRALLELLSANKTAILGYLSELNRTLAHALGLLEQAQALRSELHVFSDVADLARQYHAAGDLEMVHHAVASAARMLADADSHAPHHHHPAHSNP
jgi:hypothetical protein